MGQGRRNLEAIENLSLIFLVKVLIDLTPELIRPFTNRVKVIDNPFQRFSILKRLQMSHLDLLDSLLDSEPQLVVTNLVQSQGIGQGEDFLEGPCVDGQG